MFLTDLFFDQTVALKTLPNGNRQAVSMGCTLEFNPADRNRIVKLTYLDRDCNDVEMRISERSVVTVLSSVVEECSSRRGHGKVDQYDLFTKKVA